MAGLHLTGPMPNMNQGMLSQQQQHQLQHQAQQHQLQQQQLLQAGNPQQQQQQQQQSVMNAVNQPANPNSAADHQKLDHIAKVKNLLWPLKESLATGMKNAAQNFFHNGMIDNGTMKGADSNEVPRFDKQLEEFYSICDQIELNLQAAIMCSLQSTNSHRFIPTPVSLARQEPSINQDCLSYPSYIGVAKNQVGFVKDVVEILNDAAQNLSNE